MSRAYQLDSLPVTEEGELSPQPSTFAYGLEKPISAEALYRSMLVATGNWPAPKETEAQLRASFLEMFPKLFHEEYSPTLKQALFLSNSSLMDLLLKPQEGNLVSRLVAAPNHQTRTELAFREIYGRKPDAEETAFSEGFLSKRGDRLSAACGQLVWAMLSSPEFRLNH